MAKTVKNAFDEFMRDSVNLDPQDVSDAKESKDYLIKIISGYDSDDFFHLCQDFNEEFGSFARKTKMGILDDIDMMFGISADGATYEPSNNWNDIKVYGNWHIKEQKECMDLETGLLNSRSVLNKFKERLGQTYSTSDHPVRDGEAVKLELRYDWSFDVVPCFYTVDNFFLIPNGYGGWKKTDPREDRDFIQQVNQKHDGNVLPLIRLCKKWFEVKKFETPMSYLIETMVAKHCASKDVLCNRIDYNFINFLIDLPNVVNSQIMDMKKIQGDINDLSKKNRDKISERAKADQSKVYDIYKARNEEKYPEYVINLWREIFGEDFPTYG